MTTGTPKVFERFNLLTGPLDRRRIPADVLASNWTAKTSSVLAEIDRFKPDAVILSCPWGVETDDSGSNIDGLLSLGANGQGHYNTMRDPNSLLSFLTSVNSVKPTWVEVGGWLNAREAAWRAMGFYGFLRRMSDCLQPVFASGCGIIMSNAANDGHGDRTWLFSAVIRPFTSRVGYQGWATSSSAWGVVTGDWRTSAGLSMPHKKRLFQFGNSSQWRPGLSLTGLKNPDTSTDECCIVNNSGQSSATVQSWFAAGYSVGIDSALAQGAGPVSNDYKQ